MADNKVSIQLTLDGQQTVVNGVRQVSDHLDRMGGSLHRSIADIAHLGGAFAVFSGMSGSIAGAARALDNFSTAASRLNLVSNSLQSSIELQGKLFKVAQDARVGYTELAEVYARMAKSAGNLGISQDRLLGVTKTLSQAMTIGGGAAASMQAALVQLGQGLASGTLRGEELNSILEQTPRLAQAIADGMGVGVGELRKLGEQGAITAKQIIVALEKEAPKLAEEFARVAPTLGSAFTVLKDGASKAFYEFDKGTGISAELAKAMLDLGKAMGDAGSAAREFGERWGGAIKVAGEIGGLILLAGTLGKIAGWLGQIARFAANPITISIGLAGGAYEGVKTLATSEAGLRAAIRNAENEIAALENGGRSMLGDGGTGFGVNDANAKIDAARQRLNRLREDLARVELDADANSPRARALAAMRASERSYEADQKSVADIAPFPGAKPLAEVQGYVKTSIALQEEWNRKAIELAESYANAIDKSEKSGNATEKLDLERRRGEEMIGLAKDYQKKIADLSKSSAGNDASQIFAAQIAAERDFTQTQVKLIKERVAQRVISEEDGIEQTIAAQQEGYEKQAAMLQAQFAKAADVGDKSKIAQEIAKLNNDMLEFTEQAATARAKMGEAAIKARQAYLAGMIADEEKHTQSLKKSNDALRDEIATIGLSAEEQAAYAAAKLESAAASEWAAAKENEEAAEYLKKRDLLPDMVESYYKLADARRESAEAMNEQGGLTRERGVKKAADDARKEWEKTADSINNSLTDALLRGFESGKSFAENFRDTLKNMFQTLVLRPVISAVLAPVAGGIASLLPGSAMAGQGGAGGAGGMLNLASTGSSLYNMVSGGSGLYSSFATSGIGQAIGLSAPPSVTSGMAAIGGTGGGITLTAKTGLTAATQTGITAPVVGGVGEATTLTSLGSTIGAALPWIGGALAIASLFGGGGLFGKKAKTPKINLINADIDGWSQFDTAFGTISGAAKHDKNFAQTFDGLKPIAQMDASIAALLSQSEIDAVKTALAGTGTGEVKSKGNVAEDFVRNRLDIITDAVGGWVNDLADTAEGELQDVYTQTAQILAARKMQGAETLAQSLLGEGGGEFFRESGTAAAAFARMAEALGAVNPVLEQINVGVLAMTASAGNAATDLVKAFGSVDAFRNSTGAYYANFFSEAERAEAQQRQLKGQVFSTFAEFGAQVPKTRTEFRALVESLDVTTESGQKAFAALMNISSAFAAITVNADAAVAAERRAVIEARRAREAAAQASVETVAEAVKGLRQSVASDAAIAGGIIGGIRVSADEYEQFSGFADALATARSELAKVPAEMTGAIAAIEQQIVETVRLLGDQVAPLRLRQGDAQGALAALMAGVRIPSDRYTDANGNFVAAGLNRAMLFEQAKASQQLGNQASADALNIQNVGGVLASLAGITQSQEFQFALREQLAGSLGVPIQGALMDVLSGAFDFAARATASGYISNGIGLARVRATGAQLSAAQTGADIDAYKAAIRNLNGAMKAGSIDAEQYQTGLDAIGEIFKATIPLVDNLEAQAERVRNASLEWGRAGLESITYYFGQIGEQVAQMAEAAAAAAEPIALATSAIGRMNSVSSVFGESASAAYYGLAGGGADGRAMLYGSMGTIGNAALVSTAAAIAAEIMTTADAARVAEQLSTQFAGTQRRDASLLLDGLSAYDSGAFERSFARLNNALNKGDISTDQYRELFDLSIKTYQGTETAANDLQDAFEQLRKSAKSLADELLIDKGLTPLSTPQRFAEIRRQYEETIAKARTGDLDAIGDMEGITRTMLDAARNNAGSAEEYNLFSAGTIRTLRDLEAEQPLVLNPTPLLSGRSNATEDMLKELQALRAEIAAMRADNSAENVAIVKATNKTANVLDAVTTGNLTFTTEAA